MKLKTRVQSQRDSRWGSIMLGWNTALPYNIYNYGCLITSLANYIDKQPDEVNVLIKNGDKWTVNSGFTQGSGNFIWPKSPLVGLSETYLSPRCQAVPFYATEIAKLREFIKSGKPALCEVDFNPADDPEQMHFVLAVGYTDTEIIVVDPWEGQYETWTDGAFQRNTYQYRVYDKVLPQDDGIVTIPVDSKTFENLVRKSTAYDHVLSKLNVQDSETIVQAELDKLISYEDVVGIKDKLLGEANDKIILLEAKIAELTKNNEDLVISQADLTKKTAEQTKTIEGQGLEIQSLSTSIEELKKQITTPVYKGWKAALIKFIGKL